MLLLIFALCTCLLIVKDYFYKPWKSCF